MERLIGILESNGSFVVNIIKNEAYSSGYGVGINFTFRSIEKDLIEHVHTLLTDKGIDSNIKGNTLILVGNDNLQKFCRFIEKCGGFISIKRQGEFLSFKKILNFYKNKEHLTVNGIEKIRKEKENLK